MKKKKEIKKAMEDLFGKLLSHYFPRRMGHLAKHAGEYIVPFGNEAAYLEINLRNASSIHLKVPDSTLTEH